MSARYANVQVGRESIMEWFRRFKARFESKKDFDEFLVFCAATVMLCVTVTTLLVVVIVVTA